MAAPGNTTSSTGSLYNLFRNTGEYQDRESGFYYLRARYYDPATHQFLTRDPLLAVTGQAYNYAAGSPLNATDPSGLDPDGPEYPDPPPVPGFFCETFDLFCSPAEEWARQYYMEQLWAEVALARPGANFAGVDPRAEEDDGRPPPC